MRYCAVPLRWIRQEVEGDLQPGRPGHAGRQPASFQLHVPQGDEHQRTSATYWSMVLRHASPTVEKWTQGMVIC